MPRPPVAITGVKTFLICGGISNWLIVKIETDAGVSGIGDATLEGQSAAVRELVESLKDRYVIGRSVFDVGCIASSMAQQTFWRGGPVLMSAIGGIEIAMWDVVGRLLDVPIYQLFGGRCRDRIRAYANGWYRSASDPARFADDAIAVIEKGYTALKLDPLARVWGEFTPAEMKISVEIVQRVRDTVGDDVDILLDLHGRLSPPAARAFLDAIEPCRPYWIEEPIHPEHIDALGPVMEGHRVRLALGERMYTRFAYRDFFRRGHADVVQPDLGHAGGLLEGRAIATLAESEGVAIAPHTGNSPIITAASLHLAAVSPNALIQETFEEFDHPTMRKDLFDGVPIPTDGMLPIPDRAGLGIEFNEDAAGDYPFRPDRARRTAVLLSDDWPRVCWEEA